MKKLVGFTLAEVLITLGIIGIVAALTIPSLIENTQKKEMVVKLEKTYSALDQAYKLSVSEKGNPSADDIDDMGTETYFNTYWAPYINNLKYVSYKDMGYKSIHPFVTVKGVKWTMTVTNTGTRTAMSLPDGIYVILFHRVGNSLTQTSHVLVDLNGSSEPNKLGKDVFMFTRADDHIETLCYESSISGNKHVCEIEGTCCAAWIKSNGWKLPKDYPW